MLYQSRAISFNLPFFLIFQSRTFHENGKRHQQAVENRLYEIKRKGAKDEKKSTLEEKWLQDMEEKAMSDYRKKDLGNNSDLTAQIFNQKRAQRDAEEEGKLLTFKIKPSSNIDYQIAHSTLVDYLAQVIYAKNCPTTLYCIFLIGMGSNDHHAKYQGVFP